MANQFNNDLLIVDKTERKNCNDYKVFKKDSSGSDHAPLTFRWNFVVQPLSKSGWINSTKNAINWEEGTVVKHYQSALHTKLQMWEQLPLSYHQKLVSTFLAPQH